MAHLGFLGWCFFVGWVNMYLMRFWWRMRTRTELKRCQRYVIWRGILGYLFLLGSSLVLFRADIRKDLLGYLWLVGMSSASIAVAVAGAVLHIRRILNKSANLT
jgi:hypothetical protein